MRIGLLHGGEVADAVVQKHGGAPLRGAWAADEDDERHLLGVGAGDRVHGAEAAHAPGDAHGADAVDARVGVRRVAGVELIAGADELDARCDQPVHEGEHVIARHAERVLEAGLLEALGEISGDRGLHHGRNIDLPPGISNGRQHTPIRPSGPEPWRC